MQVNADKSEFIIIRSANRDDIFHQVKVAVQGKLLERRTAVKILGVHITEHLKWDVHTSYLIKNLNYVYRGFSRSCRLLKEDTKKLLYNATVASRLNYSDAVWDICGARNKRRLQTIQNRCVRRITGSRPGTSAAPLIKSMGWLDLEAKRKLHKCVLLKKIVDENGPRALKELMTCFRTGGTVNTRLTAHGGYILPKFNTDYFRNSFFCDTIKIWNSLPAHLREIKNINTFKENLHKFFAATS